MERLFLTVGFLSVFLIAFANTQAVHRSAYGQFCNETVKCDKRSWLSCQSSVCACMLEDMVYDPVKSKCLSKSGERCRFQISDFSENKNVFALYENTECVSNANCDDGFTCSCVAGYFETIEGTCTKQKDIRENCSSSAECMQDKYLVCVDRECLCSVQADHIYGVSTAIPEKILCVGKAGKKLTGSNTTCINGTSLTNGVCQCTPQSEYFAGDDGLCYRRKAYDENCGKDEECIYDRQFLSCQNGKCGCNSSNSVYRTFRKEIIVERQKEVRVYSHNYNRPDHSDVTAFYEYSRYGASREHIVRGTLLRQDPHDYSYSYINVKYNGTGEDYLNQCVGLANLGCNPESNCISDATCSNYRICICNSGFSATSKRMCGIGHGRKCSAINPCSDSFLCTNGVCNCPQFKHQIYNTIKSKCVGLISSFCNTDDDCNTNSVCLLNSKTNTNQCQCIENFVENGEGKCEKSWGSACANGDSIPCDVVGELECRNGVCNCQDTMSYFNSTIRKCVGLVGSRCSNVLSGVGSKICVEGASCVQENKKISGQCLCSNGYEVTEKMLCGQDGKASAEEFDMGHDELSLNVIEEEGSGIGNSSKIGGPDYYSERP